MEHYRLRLIMKWLFPILSYLCISACAKNSPAPGPPPGPANFAKGADVNGKAAEGKTALHLEVEDSLVE